LNGLLFDGPPEISNAHTRPTKNVSPSVEQMMYYNYWAMSMYYAYDHKNLTCTYCEKVKDDVANHTIIDNDFHNTIAIVALSHKRKEIVVSYRGTLNAWNVVLDALLICGSNPGSRNDNIKIHRGFYIATMSLYKKVVKAVGEYLNKNRNYKIVISGHSLGGAMARVTFFFLKDLNQFPCTTYELYTYGEPRVGNKAFAKFMTSQNITSARVVARGDIFPHVPPTSVLGTKLLGDYYVHPQTEFWINGKAGQRFCSQCVFEDPKCSMSMGPLYTVVDHLTYFDCNVASVVGQPLVLAYLPLGLLNPVKVLPPLPKPIENLIGGIASGLLAGASPALG